MEMPAPQAQATMAATVLQPWHVALDQPERYAAASLESNPIHLHDHVAQASGLPGRILHGMCTLAYSARVLTDHLSASAPDDETLISRSSAQQPRLKAIIARFARPVFPRDTLTCRLLPDSVQNNALHFDVVQQHGVVVLSRGFAQF